MTNATPPTGQFEFLNALRKGRAMVTLYLVNGIRLQGRIASFDRYAVLLQSREGDVLIQNHAISTIGRDSGGASRRPRDAESRAGEARPGEPRPPRMPRDPSSRPPRPFPGVDNRSVSGVDNPLPTGDSSYRPEPRRPAPTVTIVRKGSRRVRPPEGSEPQ